jgi:hypothetical protein
MVIVSIAVITYEVKNYNKAKDYFICLISEEVWLKWVDQTPITNGTNIIFYFHFVFYIFTHILMIDLYNPLLHWVKLTCCEKNKEFKDNDKIHRILSKIDWNLFFGKESDGCVIPENNGLNKAEIVKALRSLCAMVTKLFNNANIDNNMVGLCEQLTLSNSTSDTSHEETKQNNISVSKKSSIPNKGKKPPTINTNNVIEGSRRTTRNTLVVGKKDKKGKVPKVTDSKKKKETGKSLN